MDDFDYMINDDMNKGLNVVICSLSSKKAIQYKNLYGSKCCIHTSIYKNDNIL